MMMTDVPTNPVDLTQPPRPRALLLAALIITLFFIAPAAFFMWMLTHASTSTERLVYAFLALAFSAIPVWLTVTLIRRKARTGQWFVTPEERLEARRKWSTEKPLWLKRTEPWLPYLNFFVVFTWTALAIDNLWNWRTRTHASIDLKLAVLYILCAALSLYSARKKTNEPPAPESPQSPAPPHLPN